MRAAGATATRRRSLSNGNRASTQVTATAAGRPDSIAGGGRGDHGAMATPPRSSTGPLTATSEPGPGTRPSCSHAVALLPADARPTVVDVGAGTGIALEALLPRLSADAEVHAVDVSRDMITIGREKFPHVMWEQGKAEEFLGRFTAIDFVVSAQSYQWMDRPAFLAAAARALRPGGVCMVVQNSRDYQVEAWPRSTRAFSRKSRPSTAVAAPFSQSMSRQSCRPTSTRWNAVRRSGGNHSRSTSSSP